MIADMVADPTATYREQIHEEVDALPDEQVLMVLKIVQAVRESIMLHSPAEGLKQGLRDAKADEASAGESAQDTSSVDDAAAEQAQGEEQA